MFIDRLQLTKLIPGSLQIKAKYIDTTAPSLKCSCLKLVHLKQTNLDVCISRRQIQVDIYINTGIPLVQGIRVERLGKLGWRGRIIEIKDKMALVDWGYRENWIPLIELYPLDNQGKPYIPSQEPNLLEIAYRARSILGKRKEFNDIQ